MVLFNNADNAMLGDQARWIGTGNQTSRQHQENGRATMRLGNFRRPFRTSFLFRLDQTLRVWLISSCPFGTSGFDSTPAGGGEIGDYFAPTELWGCWVRNYKYGAPMELRNGAISYGMARFNFADGMPGVTRW
jgi:hypothetical protein